MKKILFVLIIIALLGCTRTYTVDIHNQGDHNTVNILVNAEVPKDINVKSDAEVSAIPQ